jgi:hypothetical protein
VLPFFHFTPLKDDAAPSPERYRDDKTPQAVHIEGNWVLSAPNNVHLSSVLVAESLNSQPHQTRQVVPAFKRSSTNERWLSTAPKREHEHLRINEVIAAAEIVEFLRYRRVVPMKSTV